MIVGSYVLHLYCDYPDDSYEHRGGGPFFGPWFLEVGEENTEGAAKRVARRQGWKFSRDQQRVLCPYCQKLGRSLPS